MNAAQFILAWFHYFAAWADYLGQWGAYYVMCAWAYAVAYWPNGALFLLYWPVMSHIHYGRRLLQ